MEMEDAKTFSMKGEKEMKHRSVAPGKQEVAIFVQIAGGMNAGVEIPLVIFRNGKCSYPIRGVSYNAPSRSGFFMRAFRSSGSRIFMTFVW